MLDIQFAIAIDTTVVRIPVQDPQHLSHQPRKTFIDITGQRFGRLIVQSRSERRGHEWCWSCLCDCGTTVAIGSSNIRSGRQRSCGCLHDEVLGKANITHGATTGKSWTSEYKSWVSAKGRCFNTAAINYANYGGRGITMCREWRDDFSLFLRDMGPKPSPAHSIDRIDNDGPYSPSNCRWATLSQQSANRRVVRRYDCNGGSLTIPEIARAYNIPYSPLWLRLRHGQSVDEAVAGIRRRMR